MRRTYIEEIPELEFRNGNVEKSGILDGKTEFYQNKMERKRKTKRLSSKTEQA